MERKEKRSRQQIFDIVIKICLSICLLFTLILYIYGQFFVKNASLYANKCDHYDAVWSYTDPNGVTRQYRAPDVFDVRGVDDVQLSMTLQAVLTQQLVPKSAGGRALACELMLVTDAIRNL
ncbi:MAG: hypothetical protein IK096_06165, partial [Lachnospiraceae bacterium]|nr:hypothetical protein [Lachnospiraceae bacterium]